MSSRGVLASLLVLTLSLEVKTQFYDFFNAFNSPPTTIKTMSRRHYEFYITPDEETENEDNNRRNNFNSHKHSYTDSSEEADPYSYFTQSKETRTEKPRATVKIKTPARKNLNNSNNNSSQNKNSRPDNYYYKEENDNEDADSFDSWNQEHNMNKRKPAQNDKVNIFNTNTYKTTSSKPSVNNNRYPSNDYYTHGRPTNNNGYTYNNEARPTYNNQQAQNSYTTLKPIFDSDKPSYNQKITTTRRPVTTQSYKRPEYNERPSYGGENRFTTKPTYYTRPEYSSAPEHNKDRPNTDYGNLKPQHTTIRPEYNSGYPTDSNQNGNSNNRRPQQTTLRPEYNSGYPTNGIQNGNSNNRRPQQTTLRPEYNSGYPTNGNQNGNSNNRRPQQTTLRPEYNSGYPTNSNQNGNSNNRYPQQTTVRPDYNNGYPSNNNQNGYSNNNRRPDQTTLRPEYNNGYPSNGRPFHATNRPGVKPTRPPQGPPITNKPFTQKPQYSPVYPGDDGSIRFPDDEDGEGVTPELVIGPDEDRMSEGQRRRYVDYVERLCSTYKAGDTSVVAAIPLLPSPEPVRVNVSDCGPSSIPLVVGGRVLDIQQMPHNAALGWKNVQKGGYSWKCGGSLISEQFVLTAAHCATQERDNSVSTGPPRVVQLGSSYINDPGALTIKVAKSVKHPKYNPPRSYYDLALLKLATRVMFSEVVKPACIGVAPSAGHPVIATGWGRTQFGGDTSDVLRGVSLPIWELEECSRVLGTSRRLPDGPSGDSQLCAGEKAGGKDTCQGDSGGPIQVQEGCIWRVVGVTSLGRACGAAGTPALYAIAQRAFIGAVLNGY